METLQLGALELLSLYLSTCAKVPTLAGCENLIHSWQKSLSQLHTCARASSRKNYIQLPVLGGSHLCGLGQIS